LGGPGRSRRLAVWACAPGMARKTLGYWAGATPERTPALFYDDSLTALLGGLNPSLADRPETANATAGPWEEQMGCGGNGSQPAPAGPPSIPPGPARLADGLEEGGPLGWRCHPFAPSLLPKDFGSPAAPLGAFGHWAALYQPCAPQDKASGLIFSLFTGFSVPSEPARHIGRSLKDRILRPTPATAQLTGLPAPLPGAGRSA